LTQEGGGEVAFWSAETLDRRIRAESLVSPYTPSNVQSSAYELSLGPQVFITSDPSKTRRTLVEGEQVVIPPGQFALLLTEEKIQIPTDSMGFISIKAGIKFRGLVNVSGFHVDPGFQGRLKFAVYNAGSTDIVLSRGKQLFMIWFCFLDSPTSQEYRGSHANQDELTADDVMKLQGEVASPAALNERVKELERRFNFATNAIKAIVVAVILAAAAGVIANLVTKVFERKNDGRPLESAVMANHSSHSLLKKDESDSRLGNSGGSRRGGK